MEGRALLYAADAATEAHGPRNPCIGNPEPVGQPIRQLAPCTQGLLVGHGILGEPPGQAPRPAPARVGGLAQGEGTEPGAYSASRTRG